VDVVDRRVEVGEVVGGGLRGFIPFGNVAVWNILGDFSLSVAWSAAALPESASPPSWVNSFATRSTSDWLLPTASAIGLL
jgi:hypothetical protein